MTVKELIVELISNFELDSVVEYTGTDLGWCNITTAGDRFNPKIIPDFPEKHMSDEWFKWVAMNKRKQDD